MPEIFDLLDMEFDDPELEPTILPVDARLSFRGRVDELRALFERLTAVSPQKEIITGTSYIHVSISVDADRVLFTATDSERTLALETSSLKIQRVGMALLPGHKILKILNLAPEDHITITVLANTATLTSGRAIWNVATLSGERMHSIPEVGHIPLREVPRKSLFKGLTVVRRGLPVAGSRPSLMQSKIEAGHITTADGARLLRYDLDGFPLDLALSIPARAIDDVLKALRASSSDTIQIGSDDTHIVVKVGGDLLISSQLLLPFPDVDSLLLTPALANTNKLILPADELRDIIKRIRISADPEYATILLMFSKAKGADLELTVVTRDRSGNSASEKMFAIWEGEDKPSELCLNHKFLLDLLDSFGSGIATFLIGTDAKTRLSPIYLRDEDKKLTGLIQQSSTR